VDQRTVPRICAHAGCEGLPLDGGEALEAGIAAGADVVEVDLRFTPDGVAVSSHDPLHRRSTPPVPVEPILAALARHPHIAINVDVKELANMVHFPNPFTRGEVVNPFHCTGLVYRQIDAFQKGCPGLACAVNDLPWWFGLVSKKTRVDALKRLRDEGIVALNLSYRRVDEALMEVSRQAGLPVRVWTVDEPAAMDAMIALGVDSITTHRVSVLQQKRSPWTPDRGGGPGSRGQWITGRP